MNVRFLCLSQAFRFMASSFYSRKRRRTLQVFESESSPAEKSFRLFIDGAPLVYVRKPGRGNPAWPPWRAEDLTHCAGELPPSSKPPIHIVPFFVDDHRPVSVVCFRAAHFAALSWFNSEARKTLQLDTCLISQAGRTGSGRSYYLSRNNNCPSRTVRWSREPIDWQTTGLSWIGGCNR
jgi:hypothetical protein